MRAREKDFIFSRLFCCGVVLGALLSGCQYTSDESNQAGFVRGGTVASPETVLIPAGDFIAGSDSSERELAYSLDEQAYGHSRTRKQKWYARERTRKLHRTKTFSITKTPITNKQYAAFVQATGYHSPDVNEHTWRSYGLVHPYSRAQKFAWKKTTPLVDREQHPVVLVSYKDAVAYADWLSQQTDERWRLPTELEWEKAARGTEGHIFPWGNEFDRTRLNSHDAGPFDTLPVGQFPTGESPFGILDAAGQVFEWTADVQISKRAIVKGGSWDDKGCGVCRAAARHTRPIDLKHILIGFRLIREHQP